jgi:hypothetical protein
MFVSLRLITLPPAHLARRDAIAAQLRSHAASLVGVASCWAAPVYDTATINAGHIIWRMEFATEVQAMAVRLDPAWRADIVPLLDRLDVTSIGYYVTRSAMRPYGAGIWRALIFRVMPSAFPVQVAALEAGLLMLPKYISTIRSWALSPVATLDGPKAYTHVWEQEFDDISGLTGEYMTHPIHWGVVDSWFDAECPNYVVDPQLIQVIGKIDNSIMGAHGGAHTALEIKP